MTRRAGTTDWASRVDPLIERYRRLVPFIGQDDATLAISAVGRMILAVEKARSARSLAAVSLAEDAILEAGKLLESVGHKGGQGES